MASEDVLDRARDHERVHDPYGYEFCRHCNADWPCLVSRLAAEVRELRERKDGAYYERNQVVAALAKCYPSGTARTAIEGWSDDWHGCVYIDLPTGQVSWHFHNSHAHLFADLPPYTGSWDGHDTAEKYRRLSALDGELRRDKERLDWLLSRGAMTVVDGDEICVDRVQLDAALAQQGVDQ